MKANIIRIGNSLGLRIPKPLIEQCGFEGQVELTIDQNRLIISPSTDVRVGWSNGFQEMAQNGDDQPLLAETNSNEFDDTEWEW